MAKKKAPQIVEYKKTCHACGNVWFVTPQEAHERAPSGGEMRGAKMQATGAAMTLFSRRRTETQLRLMRLEEKKERIESRNRCPACGSTRYSLDAVL